MIDDAKIRWTAPRHADDHMPDKKVYTLWLVKRGPRYITILAKYGVRGKFEIGFHIRYPRRDRWLFAPWIRIVA